MKKYGRYDDEDDGFGRPKCGIVDRLFEEKDDGFEMSKYEPPKLPKIEIKPLYQKEDYYTNDFRLTDHRTDFGYMAYGDSAKIPPPFDPVI